MKGAHTSIMFTRGLWEVKLNHPVPPHVPALVQLLHVFNAEHPMPLLHVRYAHAVVLCDDVVLDGENNLGIHTQPRDMQRKKGGRVSSERDANGRGTALYLIHGRLEFSGRG